MKAEGERVSSVSGTCLFCGVEGLLTEEQVKLEMIKKLVKPLISESSGKGCCISCSSFMDRLILLNADIAQTSANFRDTSAVINSLLGMKRNITLSESNFESPKKIKPITVKFEELILDDTDEDPLVSRKEDDIGSNTESDDGENGIEASFDYSKEHVDTSRFNCSTCNKTFKTKTLILRHKSRVHSKQSLKCAECGRIFKCKYSLNLHLRVHKPNRKQYVCEYCGKSFISWSGWSDHTKRHYGVQRKRKHKCYFCGFAALAPSMLLLHMLSHTLEKPWKCNICGLRLSSAGGLKQHKDMHSGTLTVTICPVPGCGARIRWKQDLKRHIQRHDAKSSRCEFETCSYSTIHAKHMIRHVRTVHRKKTEFHCPHCDKVFQHKSGVKRHLLRKHSDKRDFKCDHSECDKIFVTQNLLIKHKKNVHS